MRSKTVGALVTIALVMLPGLCRADLIDRVLAVVGGTVITQSDVAAALTFGFVRAPAAGKDPVRSALDQLIRRELILTEVGRYAAIDTDPAAVEKRMQQTRARFASAAAFEAALNRTAMNISRLHDIVEGDVRIEEYMKQRFAGAAEPGDAEVAAYYAAHRSQFTSGGRPLSLEEAAGTVRQRLIEQRRSALIDEWVARLRRRAEVTDLYFATTGK